MYNFILAVTLLVRSKESKFSRYLKITLYYIILFLNITSYKINYLKIFSGAISIILLHMLITNLAKLSNASCFMILKPLKYHKLFIQIYN